MTSNCTSLPPVAIVGVRGESELLRICDTRRDISDLPKPIRSMITGMWMLRFCIFLCLALRAVCQQFDIAIVNGRVMDPESGLDQIRSIGVRDGRIAAVSSETLSGKTVVDARGLVIAPGFIDLHSHGQTPENYRFKARDGVTTALELEVGAWPV